MPISYRTNLIPIKPIKKPARITGASPKERLLAILECAANENRRCPSNSELGEALGYAAGTGHLYWMDKLAADGVIYVDHFNQARVVTIVSTGKSTAAPKNTKPHWRHGQKTERPE